MCLLRLANCERRRPDENGETPKHLTMSDSELQRVQDPILKYISKNFINVDSSTKIIYKSHLNRVVNFLIETMREDKFFDKIYGKIHFAGSYWDGLKVGLPTEFDINLIYKLPFLKQEYSIIKAAPGYVLINVSQEGLGRLKKKNAGESFRKLEKWFDTDGNMIADNFRYWQESIVEKTLAKLPNDETGAKILITEENNQYKMKFRKAGPAITLKVIVLSENISFDIDIVPAMEFCSEIWPTFVRQCPLEAKEKYGSWHVVPKPYDPHKRAKLCVKHENIPLCWRLSFHDVESFLIHSSSHLKPTLKFLKKLRDVKEQSQLHSYALKTLFLLENSQQDDQFWKRSLFSLFIEMLNNLYKNLSEGGIPSFWDADLNILAVTDTQLGNIRSIVGNTLTRIRSGLKTEDKFVIARELCNEEELQKLMENTTFR